MWAHKAIKLVEEQFILISNEVRRIKEALASPGTEPAASRRGEVLKLHNSVFDLLSGGEELPIYRGNYIEISEHLVKICDSLDSLPPAFRGIPPEERARLTTIPELIETVREAVSRFLGTWLNLDKDIRRSEAEIKSAADFIFQLENAIAGICRGEEKKQQSAALNNFCDRCNSLVAALYSIDLSLKKLIVMRIV